MRYGIRATLLVMVYLAVALAPLPLNLIQLDPSRGFVIDFSVALGFVGLSVLSLQFVLAARIHTVTAPYGIDRVLQFHRQITYVAIGLVLLHPILLFVLDSRFVPLLNVWTSPLRAKFAVASVVALLVLFFTSVWRRRFRMSYESWQLMHSVLAVLVVATGLLHALLVGYYISQPWEKGLWAAMTAGLVGLGIWVRIVKPLQRQRHKWRVLGVAAEPNSSYTVTLAPDSPTVTPFSFRPGQFAWLLTGSSTPFALTYHPFSISSSAEDTSRVSFTIKDTGDFTDAVSRLQSGDIIYVDGPWGEFTMDRHEGPGFVLIAAGIGVTPMLSMLKTLADRDDRRPCWLFLGNRDQDSVACQGELDALTPRLDLEIVHVLSHAQPGWNGETGYLRAEIFDRHLPKGRARLQYFICGPPAMMRSSEEALAQLHIPRDHVHVERFAMV